jgi:hypothetical protein
MLKCKTDWDGHQAMMAGLEVSCAMLDDALQTPELDAADIDHDTLVVGWLNMAMYSLSKVVDPQTVLRHLRGYVAQQDKFEAERKGTEGRN